MPRERLDDEIEGDVPPPGEIDAMVARLNEEYFVVNQAGDARVYRIRFDPHEGRNAYDKMRFDDFRKLLQNERMLDADGKPKSVADIWLNRPDRKQYISGVVFEPEKSVPKDQLNLWRGFSVKPAKGSWDKLLWHIEHIVCDGDQAAFEYALKWMAYFVQHPGRQGEVAFVMRGKEGTGKGIIGRALMHIVRQHAIQISDAKHLTGSFNAHLFNCVLVFADEAFFAGNPAHVGALKRLVTEPTLFIEAKFQQPFLSPNYVHLLMASNEEWVVPASLEARRFFVTNVSDQKRNEFAYFKAIYDELENGGYEAMLHDLLEYDLSGFNVRYVPQTAGLQDQKMQSLGLEHSWWLDVLMRGFVYESKYALDPFNDWWPEVATDLLYKSYEAYVAKTRSRKHLNREMFGKFLVQELDGQQCKPRRLLIGETIAPGSEPTALWGRKPAYRIGTLKQARETFVAKTKLTPNWSEDTTVNAEDTSEKRVVALRERFGGK